MIYFLGLGTNLGNKEKNLKLAIKKLSAILKILKRSNIYESKPMGPQNQPDFLNMVIKVETNLEPLKFLAIIKNIEKEMGRKKTEKWEARVIDVDILIFKEKEEYVEINLGHKLEIPHPGILEREFVLKPLEEIAPGLLKKMYKKSFDEILKNAVYTVKNRKYKL
ncbi:2-amino-4-hydroxy-6-hydroxymethyldihydropteridine diphosphokinase [Candidatus Peregrinibacteria bacterium RIFOXYB2_FULL_32_7]|nr:MAG: 2-amino-4-hydroxy-6-hydroxymethyldihydropteridine diphosphokinase [Candidatus Peregrinibacteria bacterium RIFOXYB2_FULL_32_7]